jgi:chromosome partitioning protein
VHGLPAAVTAARAAGYGVLVIDTPPSVAETIAEVIEVADLVVIPAIRTRKRMVFVVSQATQRARTTAEAAIALSQHGIVAPVMIHHRVDFASSMTGGSTVGELDPDCRGAGEIRDFWTYLCNLLTEDTDHAASHARAAE